MVSLTSEQESLLNKLLPMLPIGQDFIIHTEGSIIVDAKIRSTFLQGDGHYELIMSVKEYLLHEGFVELTTKSIHSYMRLTKDRGEQLIRSGSLGSYFDRQTEKERVERKENWPKRHWMLSMLISAIIGALLKTVFDVAKDEWVNRHQEKQQAHSQIAPAIQMNKSISQSDSSKR